MKASVRFRSLLAPIVICFLAHSAFARAASGDVIVRTEAPSQRAHIRIAHGEAALHRLLRDAILAVTPYGPAGIVIYAREPERRVAAIIDWAERRRIPAVAITSVVVPPKRVQIVVYPTNGAPRHAQFSDELPGEYNENAIDPAHGDYTRRATYFMLSDPGDLVRGRGTRLSDGERAAEIVARYRSYRTPLARNDRSTAEKSERPAGGGNAAEQGSY